MDFDHLASLGAALAKEWDAIVMDPAILPADAYAAIWERHGAHAAGLSFSADACLLLSAGEALTPLALGRVEQAELADLPRILARLMDVAQGSFVGQATFFSAWRDSEAGRRAIDKIRSADVCPRNEAFVDDLFFAYAMGLDHPGPSPDAKSRALGHGLLAALAQSGAFSLADVDQFRCLGEARGLGPRSDKIARNLGTDAGSSIASFAEEGKWEMALLLADLADPRDLRALLDPHIAAMARAGIVAGHAILRAGGPKGARLSKEARQEATWADSQGKLLRSREALFSPWGHCAPRRSTRVDADLLALHEPKPQWIWDSKRARMGPASTARALALLLAPGECMEACCRDGGSPAIAAAWLSQLCRRARAIIDPKPGRVLDAFAALETAIQAADLLSDTAPRPSAASSSRRARL
jgi:hypothetical protein